MEHQTEVVLADILGIDEVCREPIGIVDVLKKPPRAIDGRLGRSRRGCSGWGAGNREDLFWPMAPWSGVERQERILVDGRWSS